MNELSTPYLVKEFVELLALEVRKIKENSSSSSGGGGSSNLTLNDVVTNGREINAPNEGININGWEYKFMPYGNNKGFNLNIGTKRPKDSYKEFSKNVTIASDISEYAGNNNYISGFGNYLSAVKLANGMSASNNYISGIGNVNRISHAANSTIIGTNVSNNSTGALIGCTFIGYDSGDKLRPKSSSYSISEVPVFGTRLFVKNQQYKDIFKREYGIEFNETSQSYEGISGLFSTYIGANSTLALNQTDKYAQSICTVRIGSNGFYGSNFQWRDFNNIIIGNFITSFHNNAQIYNSMLIGNFLNSFTATSNGDLAIHIGKDDFVKTSEALLYGNFNDRFLKINGNLRLNPTNNVKEDRADYTKKLVAKSTGEVALEDEKTIEFFIENVQTSSSSDPAYNFKIDIDRAIRNRIREAIHVSFYGQAQNVTPPIFKMKSDGLYFSFNTLNYRDLDYVRNLYIKAIRA